MDRQNRTWLCSVVFADIVSYTERSVAQQLDLKDRFQRLIAKAVAEVADADRLIVDTGDGAALCFLGDPEEALFAALNLCDGLQSESRRASTPFEARIGINLGPVKVVKNMSGQLNPLGDGINNAQRIMGFAEPNQILVSRSFFDVIACLSQEYAQLFHFQGVRKDKHVREFSVYEVRPPGQDEQRLSVEETRELAQQVRRESAPPPARRWDDAYLKIVEKALAFHIGPFAKVLVRRTAQKAATAEALYRLLAETIPMEKARANFLREVADVPFGQAPLPPVKVPEAKAQGRPEAMAVKAGAPASRWDPAVLKQTEERLAVYLGPVSKFLVKKAAEKTTDLQELYRLLAQDIPREAERRTFLKRGTRA